MVFMIDSSASLLDLILSIRSRMAPYQRRHVGYAVHLEFARKPCRVRSALVAYRRCLRLTNGLPRYLKV